MSRAKIVEAVNTGSMDIIVGFIIDIVVALVTGVANFIMATAVKLCAFGYGILAALVTCLLLWQGIVFTRRYRY